jgi:hypothetical protein
MKINALFLFSFFSLFFSFEYTFSQTRLETEYWINSKFVTHKLDKQSSTDDFLKIQISYDYLSFDDCLITLKTTAYGQSFPPYEQKYEMNIGDIKSIVWKKNTLIFTSKKFNVNNMGRSITVEKEFSHLNFRNKLEFEINGNAEPRLRERLLKAFYHLRSFCKPTFDEKEPF